MDNLNLPKFYVGQKVVQLLDGFFPKGKEHTVSAINKCICGRYYVITSTPVNGAYNLGCADNASCYVDFDLKVQAGIESGYAPLQELPAKTITYSKVLEETNELVHAN